MSSPISSSFPLNLALIYNGPGANVGSSEALKIAFSKYFRKVICVPAAYFKTSTWKDNTSLVIFPGGQCSLMIESLEDTALAEIEDYAKRLGKKVAGFCAGFYLFVTNSCYMYNEEVHLSKREHSLIDGYIRGPLTSPELPEIVQIFTPKGESGGCYAQGNPVYCPSVSTIITSLIGTYDAPKDSINPGSDIAIAVIESGAGLFAGSGVHLEFKAPRTRSPFESTYISTLYDRLTPEESFRVATLDKLVMELFPGVYIEPISIPEDAESDLFPCIASPPPLTHRVPSSDTSVTLSDSKALDYYQDW